LLGWALSRANLATGEVVDVVVENDRVVAVAAVPIILGTANATLKIGNFELAGIGVGAFAAILLYQVLLPGHRLEATVPTAEVAGT
jgi:xanthine/uracil permease